MPLQLVNREQRRANTMEKFYDETTVTRTEQGAKARALIDGVLSEIDAVEDRLDEAQSDFLPTTASGPYLLLWKDLTGIPTRNASRAMGLASDFVFRFKTPPGVATFGDLNNGNDIVIGANEIRIFGASQFLTDRGVESFEVEYELVEDVTLLAGSSEQFVTVIALQPGSDYNVPEGQLNSHDFINYATYPDLKLLAENVKPIANGDNEENDDETRFKLSTTGLLRNSEFINRLFNLIDDIPGVNRVVFLENYSGSGSIDFYIDTQTFTIPPSIINTAREKVEEVTKYTSNIFVQPVERVGLYMEISVKFKNAVEEDDKINILQDIETYVINEILKVEIGGSFDLEQLYNDVALRYAEISSIGFENRGFDVVTIYRDGLRSERVGNKVSDTFSTISLSDTERLLPEDQLSKPIVVRESQR